MRLSEAVAPKEEKKNEYCIIGAGNSSEYRKYWKDLLCNGNKITFN